MAAVLFVAGLLSVSMAGAVCATMIAAFSLRGAVPMRADWWCRGAACFVACLAFGVLSILASGVIQ